MILRIGQSYTANERSGLTGTTSNTKEDLKFELNFAEK